MTKPRALSTAIALLALAACAGGDRGVPASPQPAPRGAAEAPAPSPTARQCRADLTGRGIRFSVLPDRDFGGGCRTVDTIKLLDFGVPTTNLGAMTCPLAKNFAAWVRFAAQPAARKFFSQELVRVETMGSYACRNVNGAIGAKLSQHAFANALDVSAFVLADGRRISVADGWRGDTREGVFLRALHASACRRFPTVLGPDYNALHRDHLHLDMAGKDFCR